MIRRMLGMGTTILAAVAITACSDATSPDRAASDGLSPEFSQRSGTLHVEKECSTYTGHAGDICTLTASSLEQIEVGSRIIYASDAVGTSLDTDVILDLPGPGDNQAFGHCTVDLVTFNGGCEFSGGTGKFTWFHASVVLSSLGGPNFAWNGTYSFGPRD